MPILIKSSKGQRSCQLLTNGAPKQSTTTTAEDIIEALRGLTLKFEIKIADIIGPIGDPETTNVDENPTPTTSDAQPKQPFIQKPANPSSTQSTIAPKLEVERKISPVVQIEAKPVVEKNRVSDSHELPPISLRVDRKVSLVKPAEDVPRPQAKLSSSQTAASPVAVPRSQPKLVRGELTLGEIKTVCCIAVDDKYNPPIAYISYDDDKLLNLVKVIDNLSSDIEQAIPMKNPQVGEIILAKSIDDNKWYRAIVEQSEGDSVLVYFFDWGLRERVTSLRTRHLIYSDIGMSSCPACAIKLKFVNTPADLINQALTCEVEFRMLVEAYDDSSECYKVTILDLLQN